MKQVGRHVIIFDILAHDITQRPHFEIARAFISLHETLCLQDTLVQKALFPGILFETFWNAIVSVTHYEDQEIVFLDIV